MSNINTEYNLAQFIFFNSTHKYANLEGGRAVGKSTIGAKRMKDFTYELPRSKIALPGNSYKNLLKNTLPSAINGLELLGFKNNEHFVVGRRPNSQWRWPTAHEPPLDYEGVISFYTGTTFQLISLENDYGGRGINFDGVIGDEAAIMDVTKLTNNILASNRGNIDRYRHHWLHHSTLFMSSTSQTKDGEWFHKRQLEALKHPNEILYLIAPSTINAHNLGKDFFEENKRTMYPSQYNAEILCIRNDKVENGFYPYFEEQLQCYDATNINYLFGLNYNLEALREDNSKSDSDIQNDKPIDVACDWGTNINCVVCGQDAPLGNQYNIMNALYVKAPLTIPDLAYKFADYYSNHSKKEVNFYYDHTAQPKGAVTGTSYADEFTKALTSKGWKVNRIYVGQAPDHKSKYIFFIKVYKEDGSTRLPRVRYNKNNCKQLVVSIQQAGAIEGRNGIEKDKRPEKRKNAIHEDTTHLSDANDTLIYFKFKGRLGSAGWFF